MAGSVRQVNIPERDLILSEQATMVEALAQSLNDGDVVEGVVTRLMDYGAFVSLRSPDGGMHGAVVSQLLCNISESTRKGDSGAFTLLLSSMAPCTELWWVKRPPVSAQWASSWTMCHGRNSGESSQIHRMGQLWRLCVTALPAWRHGAVVRS